MDVSPRSAIRWLRATAFELAGLNHSSRQALDGSAAAILMYHRVIADEPLVSGAIEPGMVVRRETFAKHLEWLEECFSVMPLSEVVDRLIDGKPLPRRACAITFDDGWKDNLDHALPELARRSLPATVFVVTDRVGTTGAFWPDEVYRGMSGRSPEAQGNLLRQLGIETGGDPRHAVIGHLKGLPASELDAALAELCIHGGLEAPDARELLDWEELARLKRSGFDVESHAATHAILPRLSPAEADAELRRSRDALLERGFGEARLVAYPSGAYDAAIKEAAARVGYRAALATRQRIARAGGDPMEIPRLGVHDDVTRARSEFLYRVPGRV